MVDIGGDDEIILVFQQLQQFGIDRLRRVDIAVVVNMPCPPCPQRFLVGERIEAAGVNVSYMVPLRKVEEIPFKPFAAVSQTR